MLTQRTRIYSFEDFRLDLVEKVLLRDGKPVAVTPKVFDTLVVLVENAGRLIEKGQLMEQIWGDRFVEEGNLAFNIKMLRRALGDNAAKPHYIETLPRRGYRFIATVTEAVPEVVSRNGNPHIVPAPAQKIFYRSSGHRPIYLLAAAALITCGMLVSGFWYAKSSGLGRGIPVMSAPFDSEKLSTDGKVLDAVVSKDGRFVVYTNGIQDAQSVWLRQIDSSNNVQILEPSEHFYYGLALSPDGNLLYFTRRAKLVEGQADLYRVSIFGGAPVKIISEVQGPVSISPDGNKVSYVRCYYLENENCSLWTADAIDGRNERKLASSPRPLRIGDHEFTPDRRSLTFAIGQSENQANEFGLAEVNLETGIQREVTPHRFLNIKSIAWLPDQSALLVTASRAPNQTFHIWRVSADGDTAEPLTRDGESYASLSLDRDARMLVTTQIRQNFQLRSYETTNPAAMRVLTDATSVAFANDGKIIFSSDRTGNHEIWSIGPDGRERRQLTNNPAEDRTSVVSPDDGSIFFASNRTGQAQVWRMNADGSDQTQITASEGGFPIFVSQDGKWIYYRSAIRKTLWRVSTNGGGEEMVMDNRSHAFAISPDGTRLALTERNGAATVLKIVDLDDKETFASFALPSEAHAIVDLAWTKDVKAIAYILRNSEWKGNTVWLQPLDTGQRPQRIADLGDDQVSEMSGFALSPDGKSIAVAIGRWEHDAILLTGLNRLGTSP